MRRIRRTFTQQEKLNIINLVLNDKLSIRQVTDLHDLDRQTIHRWINEYREFGEKAFINKDFLTHEQEIRKLKKQLADAKEENEILKKAHAYFARIKKAVIAGALSAANSYKVSKVCKVLNISRSTYYYNKKHSLQDKTYPFETLIVSIFHKNISSYGRRRIQYELEKMNLCASQYIISKVLKKYDLVPKHGRKRCAHNIYTKDIVVDINPKNLIKEAPPTAKIYSADMSEFKCKGGKLIVSGIIDQRTRVIVGYSIENDYKSKGTKEAFVQAFTKFGVPDFVHTDNGSQFRGHLVHDYIVEAGAQHSFSKPRSPWHNQYIESFWKTMKVEIGRTEK